MMIYGASDALKGLLVRQGMSAGSAGTDDAQRIGDGGRSLAKGAPGHQLADGREGHRPMGMSMEKDAAVTPRQFTGVERQNSARTGGDPFPGSVADIVSEMPTRKGARPTLFLVCIDGVRV